jgi:hypothetical protein
MRHRVYARFLGKTAIVCVLDDAMAAARLTLQLRNRYSRERAEFWHSAEFQKPAERWETLRSLMRKNIAASA